MKGVVQAASHDNLKVSKDWTDRCVCSLCRIIIFTADFIALLVIFRDLFGQYGTWVRTNKSATEPSHGKWKVIGSCQPL